MSYFTQRLANTFPMWSKVRSDPSSNGYRWLESFAKQIELERINAIRLANFGFFSNVQEVANLYFIDLAQPIAGDDAQTFIDEETGLLVLPEYVKVRIAAPMPDVANGGSFPEIEIADDGTATYWITVNPAGEGIDETRYYDFVYSPPDELVVKSYLDSYDNDQADQGVNPSNPFDYGFMLDFGEDGNSNSLLKNMLPPYQKLNGEKLLAGFPADFDTDNEAIPTISKRDMRIFSSNEIDNPVKYSGFYDFSEESRLLPRVPEAPLYFTGWRLEVRVKNSRHYQRWSHPDVTPADDADFNFSGNHKVIIYGYDINGNPVGGTGAEGELPTDNNVYGESFGKQAFIPDDGIYRSKETYSEIWRIQWEGFDGEVEVYLVPGYVSEHINPFHAAITSDSSNAFGDLPDKMQAFTPAQIANSLEGPLRLELEEANGGAFLHSTYQLFLRGEEYRRNNIPLESEDDNRELLATQWLLDDGNQNGDGTYNNVEASCFNYLWSDSRTCMVGKDGWFHYYSLGFSEFEPWLYNRSKLTSIDILPLAHRVSINEEIPLWTWHRLIRSPIERVCIYRQKPSSFGVLGDIEYLQLDRTWSSDKSYFYGNINDIPERTWSDFRFKTTFDELGQWNFYCEVYVVNPTYTKFQELDFQLSNGQISENEYLNLKNIYIQEKENDALFRSCTSVMCESLKAVKSMYPFAGYSNLSAILLAAAGEGELPEAEKIDYWLHLRDKVAEQLPAITDYSVVPNQDINIGDLAVKDFIQFNSIFEGIEDYIYVMADRTGTSSPTMIVLEPKHWKYLPIISQDMIFFREKILEAKVKFPNKEEVKYLLSENDLTAVENWIAFKNSLDFQMEEWDFVGSELIEDIPKGLPFEMTICNIDLVHILMGDDDTKDASLRIHLKYKNHLIENATDGDDTQYKVDGFHIKMDLMNPALGEENNVLKTLKETIIPRSLFSNLVNDGKITDGDLTKGIVIDLVDTGFDYADYDYPDTADAGYDPEDPSTWQVFNLSGIEKVKITVTPINISAGLPADGNVWNISDQELYEDDLAAEFDLDKWTPEEIENVLSDPDNAWPILLQIKKKVLTTWHSDFILDLPSPLELEDKDIILQANGYQVFPEECS